MVQREQVEFLVSMAHSLITRRSLFSIEIMLEIALEYLHPVKVGKEWVRRLLHAFGLTRQSTNTGKALVGCS